MSGCIKFILCSCKLCCKSGSSRACPSKLRIYLAGFKSLTYHVNIWPLVLEALDRGFSLFQLDVTLVSPFAYSTAQLQRFWKVRRSTQVTHLPFTTYATKIDGRDWARIGVEILVRSLLQTYEQDMVGGLCYSNNGENGEGIRCNTCFECRVERICCWIGIELLGFWPKTLEEQWLVAFIQMGKLERGTNWCMWVENQHICFEI